MSWVAFSRSGGTGSMSATAIATAKASDRRCSARCRGNASWPMQSIASRLDFPPWRPSPPPHRLQTPAPGAPPIVLQLDRESAQPRLPAAARRRERLERSPARRTMRPPPTCTCDRSPLRDAELDADLRRARPPGRRRRAHPLGARRCWAAIGSRTRTARPFSSPPTAARSAASPRRRRSDVRLHPHHPRPRRAARAGAGAARHLPAARERGSRAQRRLGHRPDRRVRRRQVDARRRGRAPRRSSGSPASPTISSRCGSGARPRPSPTFRS